MVGSDILVVCSSRTVGAKPCSSHGTETKPRSLSLFEQCLVVLSVLEQSFVPDGANNPFSDKGSVRGDSSLKQPKQSGLDLNNCRCVKVKSGSLNKLQTLMSFCLSAHQVPAGRAKSQ